MCVLVDGVLALSLGVPDLDVVIKTTCDDLSVVLTDTDGENILLVTNQLSDSLAGGDVPETD